MKLNYFILALVFFPFSVQGQIVSEINFNGLTHTKPKFLKSLIVTKQGDQFKEEQWEKDVQLILNLGFFFQADWTKKEVAPDSIALHVELKEAFSLFPILDFAAMKGNFRLQLGANQINWLGKGYTLGGFYQYYQRNGFRIYQLAPRHLNGKTGHEVMIGNVSTIEPMYFEGKNSDFNYDNSSVYGAVNYWFDPYQKASLGVGGFFERYENTQMRIADLDSGSVFTMYKLQLRLIHEIRKLNLHQERVDGYYFQGSLERIETKDHPNISYSRLSSQFKGFVRVRNKGNLAFNLKAGIATNNKTPFVPFVLDSYINVRGIGNRVARGTAELTANLEFRQTIWTNSWFFLQTNFFTDFGALRPPGANLNSMFHPDNYDYFSGIGLRVHTRKVWNSVIRFDYGFQLGNSGRSGYVFGIKQYF